MIMKLRVFCDKQNQENRVFMIKRIYGDSFFVVGHIEQLVLNWDNLFMPGVWDMVVA
jgi:hypothetical protein